MSTKQFHKQVFDMSLSWSLISGYDGVVQQTLREKQRTMTNTDQLLHDADRLIEQNDYSNAIKRLEDIIELGEAESVGKAALILITTWPSDHHIYLNRLIAQYPEEANLYRAKIGLVMQGSRISMNTAIRFCSTALEKFGDNQRNELSFRSLRFIAALKGQVPTYMASDFIFMWKSLTVEKARPHWIQDILSISDPKLASVFSALIDSGVFSEDIQKLFQHKLEQFALFESVFPSQIPSADES